MHATSSKKGDLADVEVGEDKTNENDDIAHLLQERDRHQQRLKEQTEDAASGVVHENDNETSEVNICYKKGCESV